MPSIFRAIKEDPVDSTVIMIWKNSICVIGYRVFKSDWLIVNLYSLKNTWQKVFKFLVYVGNMLPFCYAKSQYQAIDYWKSASLWIKLPFLQPGHFLMVFLRRSCFCQPAIFKVIDLECINWSQINDHCLNTQKSTNYLLIKTSLKVLGQFV